MLVDARHFRGAAADDYALSTFVEDLRQTSLENVVSIPVERDADEAGLKVGGITYNSDSQANPDVGYSYDGFGQRIGMSDAGTSPVSYAYNADGELTSESRGADSFAYAYDSLGNLKQEVYPGSTTVDYGHDADGRLASVTSAGQTTSYSYDAADHPLTTTLPAGNGYVQTRTYDAAGRLTELKNTSGAAVLWTIS